MVLVGFKMVVELHVRRPVTTLSERAGPKMLKMLAALSRVSKSGVAFRQGRILRRRTRSAVNLNLNFNPSFSQRV